MFTIGGENPIEYMREHLAPIAQPALADPSSSLPVFYNVVSNTKLLEPGQTIPLLQLQSMCPHSEIKNNFGALIMRYMRSLTVEQENVPGLKAPSVTHLCFATGALGSTGNRSEHEARLSCHEFRLMLYYKLGLRTNFRRFTIVNMVCSSSMPYCVDLTRMHAKDQMHTDYYPDLFPGLFYYYRYEYKDRRTLHQTLSSNSNSNANESASGRRVQLLEDDLMALYKNTSAARNRTEDEVRAQVKNMLDSYLPRYKWVTVLVFGSSGKLVGLGVHDKEVALEAFQHVARFSAEFRISNEAAAAGKKRARTQVTAKNNAIEQLAKAFSSQTLSKHARMEIRNLSIDDEEERKRRIKEILQGERDKKGRRKKGSGGRAARRKAGELDDDDDADADDLSDDEAEIEDMELMMAAGAIDDGADACAYEPAGDTPLTSGARRSASSDTASVTSNGSGSGTAGDEDQLGPSALAPLSMTTLMNTIFANAEREQGLIDRERATATAAVEPVLQDMPDVM